MMFFWDDLSPPVFVFPFLFSPHENQPKIILCCEIWIWEAFPSIFGPQVIGELGGFVFFSQSWFIRWIPFCSGWLQQASYHQLTSSGGSSSSLITLQPISNQPGAHEGSSMVLAFVLLLFMSFQNSAPLGIPWPRGGEIASHSVRE